jgi:hypothetical protein
MTDKQIIEDWLQRNHNKLPTIQYSEEIYNFIVATANRIGECYNVNGIWQKIEFNQRR